MITDKQEGYVIKYPTAVEFAKKQGDVYWTADEIQVEKDVQDILVEMTPAERHGVTEVLKLFTLYELDIGNDRDWETLQLWGI